MEMATPPDDSSSLAERSCKPCEGGVAPMDEAEIRRRLADLPGWDYVDGALTRKTKQKSYERTMVFANAVAWMAAREDHHPELVIGYRTCEVRYRTHAIDGLSENDFICAAKVDRLLV